MQHASGLPLKSDGSACNSANAASKDLCLVHAGARAEGELRQCCVKAGNVLCCMLA